MSGDDSSKQKILQAYGYYQGVDTHSDYPKSDISTSELYPDGQEGRRQLRGQQAYLASPKFDFSAKVTEQSMANGHQGGKKM